MTDGTLSLREARDLYFARNDLPADGGYGDRWVRVTKGRVPLYLMNTRPRRRAVPYHDLHHVLAGYDTSSRGEAEISAWELGAGTRPHWIATVLDLAALATGLVIAPRRTFRAFVRGRRCRSLYAEPLTETLLATPTDEVRAHLGLRDAAEVTAEPADALLFAGLSVVSVLVLASIVVCAPLLILIGPLLR